MEVDVLPVNLYLDLDTRDSNNLLKEVVYLEKKDAHHFLQILNKKLFHNVMLKIKLVIGRI
jgi:hypothetical protein